MSSGLYLAVMHQPLVLQYIFLSAATMHQPLELQCISLF